MGRHYRRQKSLINSDLFDFAILIVAEFFSLAFKLVYWLLGKYLWFALFNVLALVLTVSFLTWQLNNLIFLPVLLWFGYSLGWTLFHLKDIWDEDDIREGACKIAPLCGSAYCLVFIFCDAFSVF